MRDSININLIHEVEAKQSGNMQPFSLNYFSEEKFQRFVEKPEHLSKRQDCKCSATVLIVDDNPFNLMPLRMLLETKHDITVLEANNGQKALDIFIENRKQQMRCRCGVAIRLILMDLNMPVMDGCTSAMNILGFQDQYVDWLEEGQEPIPVKIAALTAYTNQSNISECHRVGMCEVLHKPLEASELQEIILNYY